MTNESERKGESRSAMAHLRRKERAEDGAPRCGPPASIPLPRDHYRSGGDG